MFFQRQISSLQNDTQQETFQAVVMTSQLVKMTPTKCLNLFHNTPTICCGENYRLRSDPTHTETPASIRNEK